MQNAIPLEHTIHTLDPKQDTLCMLLHLKWHICFPLQWNTKPNIHDLWWYVGIVKYLILNQDFQNYFTRLRVMTTYPNRSKTEQRQPGEGILAAFFCIDSLELCVQIEKNSILKAKFLRFWFKIILKWKFIFGIYLADLLPNRKKLPGSLSLHRHFPYKSFTLELFIIHSAWNLKYFLTFYKYSPSAFSGMNGFPEEAGFSSEVNSNVSNTMCTTDWRNIILY